jgi:phage replication-related protein YjqB (UPF0714/DUF867 family)
METIPNDFKEFIQLLNEHKVRYLVVGGYAVIIHGYPRITKDIDIWVAPQKDNAGNLIEALHKFGFDSQNLT